MPTIDNNHITLKKFLCEVNGNFKGPRRGISCTTLKCIYIKPLTVKVSIWDTGWTVSVV